MEARQDMEDKELYASTQGRLFKATQAWQGKIGKER
jgi:hypothetical protein